jgi:hypothetical protein
MRGGRATAHAMPVTHNRASQWAGRRTCPPIGMTSLSLSAAEECVSLAPIAAMNHSKPDRTGATLRSLRPVRQSTRCGKGTLRAGRRHTAMNRWRREPLLKPERPAAATPRHLRLRTRTRAPTPTGRRQPSKRASLGTSHQKAELGPLACRHGYRREGHTTTGAPLGQPTQRAPRSDHGIPSSCSVRGQCASAYAVARALELEWWASWATA